MTFKKEISQNLDNGSKNSEYQEKRQSEAPKLPKSANR